MKHDEWIERAIDKLGHQYSFENTQYVHCRTKVEVVCPRHGPFLQRPDTLMAGIGCQQCGRERSVAGSRISALEFCEQVRAVHGQTISIVESTFTTIDQPVSAICQIHGLFKKKAKDITLRKRGCAKCANRERKTISQYIEEAKTVHGDKFDYSLANYESNKSKLLIICPHHGIFEQEAKAHLQGHDCKSCALRFSSSKGETQWLDEKRVIERNVGIRCAGRKRPVNVDGLDRDTKTIYMYHGDFWHGNPDFYDPKDVNKRARKTFGELYERTLENEQCLIEGGYTVIKIWESEWFNVLRARGANPPPWYPIRGTKEHERIHEDH